MEPKYIVALGGSAGATTALRQALHQLPEAVPAVFLVTMHLGSHGESMLPAILAKASALPAFPARDRQPIKAGQVFVAPPRVHMVVERGRIRLLNGPSENQQRPAINPLFRSAALAYGRSVIGIVLSGMLDDGSAGLAEIKRQKGLCIVQQPNDALFSEMPNNAILEASPHFCLTADEIRQFLVSLNSTRPQKSLADARRSGRCPHPEAAPHIPVHKQVTPGWKKMEATLGPATGLICPDCGGPLWEAESGRAQQFRCLVGHDYSPQSLLAAQHAALERSLWAALRALEERAEIQHRLASRAGADLNNLAERAFESRARETDSHATRLRNLILNIRH